MFTKADTASEPRSFAAKGEGERRVLTQALRDATPAEGPLRILEAGCGQRWPLRISDVNLHITGVDLDEDALFIRQTQRGDLDDAILGDLRTVVLPSEAFDVATAPSSWNTSMAPHSFWTGCWQPSGPVGGSSSSFRTGGRSLDGQRNRSPFELPSSTRDTSRFPGCRKSGTRAVPHGVRPRRVT